MYQRLTDTNSCRYNKQNDACWGKKATLNVPMEKYNKTIVEGELKIYSEKVIL